MRIIAGIAKGRKLTGPGGSGTRPLTGRTKEALFSSLGSAVEGAIVLDLFAGSGSIGLEALSRGARDATFVERGRPALTALRANVAGVGLGGEIVAADVERYLAKAAGGRMSGVVDLAFVDPPYALALPSLLNMVEKLEPLMGEEGVVVIHRRTGETLPDAVGHLVLTDQRRYGDAALWRYRKETG